ncbi:MAG: permease [Oscillospiraceae bacterium]|jgi:uncharacterized membrane protein YraQ (UPF0718 family)|nr:permease [Oscillospiraceae bacterium]
MSVPVYVVTGFLGSGKTSFIKQLLGGPEWRDANVLTVQFESGREMPPDGGPSRENLIFPARRLKNGPDKLAGELAERIRAGIGPDGHEPDEIWIEWNGMFPFGELYAMLRRPPLRELCDIRRVIHTADAQALGGLLGGTGSALPEQIAGSDLAVVRGARGGRDMSRTRRLLRGVNPGMRVRAALPSGERERREPDGGHTDAEARARTALVRLIYGRDVSPLSAFFLLSVSLALVYLAAAPVLESRGFPASRVVNVFLGIILQAVPFLLIGVLLSSAIEVFVTRAAIETRFPRSMSAGMLAAVLAGFLLPVCDCASIPIFRSLVKKGVPLPAAVTFMTVAPVINPVVMLSTYYAFGGDMRMVVGRAALGAVSAVIIGLTFAVRAPRGRVLSGGSVYGRGYYDSAESPAGIGGKLVLLLRHAQTEFWNAGKYLVIGTLVSAVLQSTGLTLSAQANSGAGLAASLAVMMGMSFVLSLCSSSDAVVARSFMGQFPTGALMGFLVFGPMMDIKNAALLSSGFTVRFIVRLALTAFAVCFLIVFLRYGLIA